MPGHPGYHKVGGGEAEGVVHHALLKWMKDGFWWYQRGEPIPADQPNPFPRKGGKANAKVVEVKGA